MLTPPEKRQDEEAARARWLDAQQERRALAASLSQPGSGYGDPEARLQDEHHLRVATEAAEDLLREYQDLVRARTDAEMLTLQRSMTRATWASVVIALATVTVAVAALILA